MVAAAVPPSKDASRAAGADIQASPIPATNGQFPAVIGRTQIMLSPARIIAAALVLGVGGMMLITQPFRPQSSVPGAAADSPSQPPVQFTGTWCVGPPVAPDRAGTETTLEVGDERMTLTRYQGGLEQHRDRDRPALRG
jgi:hypothetical protein